MRTRSSCAGSATSSPVLTVGTQVNDSIVVVPVEPAGRAGGPGDLPATAQDREIMAAHLAPYYAEYRTPVVLLAFTDRRDLAEAACDRLAEAFDSVCPIAAAASVTGDRWVRLTTPTMAPSPPHHATALPPRRSTSGQLSRTDPSKSTARPSLPAPRRSPPRLRRRPKLPHRRSCRTRQHSPRSGPADEALVVGRHIASPLPCRPSTPPACSPMFRTSACATTP